MSNSVKDMTKYRFSIVVEQDEEIAMRAGRKPD